MASGTFRVGDTVIAYPAGMTSTITGIHTFEGDCQETEPARSYSIELAHEIDISRGDLLAKPEHPPLATQNLEAMICWFTDKPMRTRGRFYLRHTTREVRAVVQEVVYKVDITTLNKLTDQTEFAMNDIGCIRLRLASPIFCDPYAANRITGSFVLVDEQTNNTVAAGMILRSLDGMDDPEAGGAIAI